ncbi:GNAT family N-acetyltransferase [Breznakiella homolactica]|uniref:GNAT family N-acetyltransferase n=1 Tax=Breznakiella homolactica TaxID=2798577 RepID=A0A7T7XPU6_9SPIR|nr:GNAT family protein [Breznakiella homolactica]QQO10286.1 GNAT family N-acetyltransferase [Breznakiella homolactica]
MYFKKLTGKKCYLSPIDAGDAEQYTAWINDMEVMNTLRLASASIDLTSERELLAQLGKQHSYSIVDIATDTLLGNCGLMDIDYIQRTAEIGIFIGNRDYWDKGYGTEALTLLIDYGYKKLNLHNIMLRVYAFNDRAVKCYEKIGFKPFGRRREALIRNLEAHDIIHMDLLPGDFYKTK